MLYILWPFIIIIIIIFFLVKYYLKATFTHRYLRYQSNVSIVTFETRYMKDCFNNSLFLCILLTFSLYLSTAIVYWTYIFKKRYSHDTTFHTLFAKIQNVLSVCEFLPDLSSSEVSRSVNMYQIMWHVPQCTRVHFGTKKNWYIVYW